MKKNTELSPEQKENAKHGEAFFPVRKYFTRLAPDYPVIPNHWHDEAELTLVTKGQCIYHIDLKEYSAEKGDILFIPPRFYTQLPFAIAMNIFRILMFFI